MRCPPLLAALAVVALTAACSGDEAGDATSCEPKGSHLEVEARGLEFRPKCLAARAGSAFTIELRNRDSVPHDVAVKRDAAAGIDLFRGEQIGRGRTTYEVPALAAGTYLFYCTVHPQQMTGRFVVG